MLNFHKTIRDKDVCTLSVAFDVIEFMESQSKNKYKQFLIG